VKFSLRMFNTKNQLGAWQMGEGASLREVAQQIISSRTRFAEIWSRYGEVEETFVGMGHHWMSYPQRFPEPWAMLAYMASAWPTATINSNFIQLPLYSPVDVAENVVTIDHLADGKFLLVCGLGWRPEEFRAAGTDVKYRVRRFEESLETCRTLWAGEHVKRVSDFWDTDGQLGILPLQKPNPPVIIGVQGPKAALRAARMGDGLLVSWVMSHEGYRSITRAYVEEHGRLDRPAPVYFPMQKFVSVDRDRSTALDRLGRMAHMFDWYKTATSFVGKGIKVNIDAENEATERTVAGTPEDVCAELIPHLEEFPYTDALLSWFAPSEDQAQIEEHFTMLCEEVILPLSRHFNDGSGPAVLKI
jgi:alkanesulfonate monooxygenase SsuD/methylene tetrahydromethanopterin reductase-like flavin-dependent oxidoreductase (luciferase family)